MIMSNEDFNDRAFELVETRKALVEHVKAKGGKLPFGDRLLFDHVVRMLTRAESTIRTCQAAVRRATEGGTASAEDGESGSTP